MKTQTDMKLLETVKKIFKERDLSFRFYEDYQSEYNKLFGEVQEFRRGHFYFLKVMALVCTKLQKVIFLDDDAFVLRDPAFLLDNEDMKRTGTLFWHDIYGIHPKNYVYDLLDLPSRTGLSGESGVLVLDKEVAWRGLYFAAYMNSKQDLFYRLVWGDKDTFFLAFEYMNMSYSFIPYAPCAIGNNETRFSFLQPGPDGVSFFIHLVSGKKIFKEKKRNQMTHVLLYDPDSCHLNETFHVVEDNGCWSELLPYNDIVGNVPLFILNSYWQAVDELEN